MAKKYRSKSPTRLIDAHDRPKPSARTVTFILMIGAVTWAIAMLGLERWATLIRQQIGNHVSTLEPGEKLVLPRDLENESEANTWPGDPFLKSLYYKLSRTNFRVWSPVEDPAISGSDAVVGAASVKPSIARVVRGRAYHSLYDLMQDMLRAGRLDLEKTAFQAYAESAAEGWSAFSLNNALTYLDQIYLEPAISYLAAGQPGHAQWCIRRALMLLEMMKLGPESSDQSTTIWLLAAILDDPMIAWEYPDRHRQMIWAATRCLPGVIRPPEKSSFLHFWQLYSEGLAAFRAHRFADARQKFDAAEKTTDRPRLDDLALLMQARSLFWACDRRNSKDSNASDIDALKREGLLDRMVSPPYTSVRALEALSHRISNENLRKDVATYSAILRSQ